MTTTPKKYLVVLVGPTAVGKTQSAITLATYFKSQIISGDSRQLYREMDIGTAKPSKIDLNLVKHHFVSTLSIHESYTVSDYEKDANRTLKNLFKEHDILFLVGGSGLFVRAVCEGLDEIPAVDSEIRTLLNEIYDSGKFPRLVRELEEVDPEYYAMADINNPRRVIRALEVYRGTGKPFSSYLTKSIKKRDYGIIKVGLNIDRDDLYNRINQRVDRMIEGGLVEEAKELLDFRSASSLQTVGYQEIFRYLLGEYDLNTAIDDIKTNTRQYAKRQLTWFKKDKDISWFEPSNLEAIIKLLNTKTQSHLN
ncbi:MAG TPA: tRNA (adenosine(37)-N6)-dimethylallyltransferase MiaA [Flavobacteriales bacterium]|nr:tRNA (adenosine(37)-N6)-dimethylallyltransferase MiaA [Flavobacteriales bacterium]